MLHLSLMETQLNQNNGSGNWITTFLFGVMFNVFAHFDLAALIDHVVQGIGSGIASGIICLLIAELGEYLKPKLKKLWLEFKAWFVGKDDGQH